MNALTLSLDTMTPSRPDLTVWTLRRRPDNVMDRWDGQSYRRTLALGDEPVEVAATQSGPPNEPHLAVMPTGGRLPTDAGRAVRAIIERTLGLGMDLVAFYCFAATDPKLGPLARRFHGVKPPRLPTIFKALVNAVACQQITLTQGIQLPNRLAESYGAAPANGRASGHA